MGNRWRPHWRTFVSTISLPHYAFSRHPKNVPHRALELAECHPSRPPIRKLLSISKENGYPLLKSGRILKTNTNNFLGLNLKHFLITTFIYLSSNHDQRTILDMQCAVLLLCAVIGDTSSFHPALSLAQNDDPQSLATPTIPDPLHLR